MKGMNFLGCTFFLLFASTLFAQDLQNINTSEVSKTEWSKIDFNGEKKGVRLRYNKSPLDFTPYNNAGVWVYNSSKKPLDITVVFNGKLRYKKFSCRYIIAPKDSVLAQVILMREKLPVENDWKKHLGEIFMYPYNLHPHWTAFDISTITEVAILCHDTSSPKLSIKAPQGVGEYIFDQHPNYDLPLPLVDKMGQLKSENWNEKLSSIAALNIRGQKDQEKYINSDFENQEYNQYGGWKNGPSFEKTGHFYTKKYKGKWYFVDPEGKLFISMGVTGVGGGSGTPTNNRENLFPKDNEIEAKYKDKPNYINYYERNLVRKYGDDWESVHSKVSIGRLKQWNINTFGAWSKIERGQKMPYTVILHQTLTNFGKMSKVPDPFDENFVKILRGRVKMAAKKYLNDEWNLGVFINNEIHWGSKSEELSAAILNVSKNVPARKALIQFLKKEYSTLDKLNQAWSTNFKNFEAAKIQDIKNISPSTRVDLQKFSALLAETYYKLCAQTMHEIMPGHLYLGSRIHGNVKDNNKEIQVAAAKYCDVVSFNIYEYNVLHFKPLYTEDKPILIGEFHFGVNERGVWGDGLKYGISAHHQSQLYKLYMGEVIQHPNLVGAHWFQWSDQPVTGRKDGENYRIGVVDVTDQEHKPLINAMIETSHQMYQKKIVR